MKYDYQSIEKKWQKIWDDNKTFATKDDYTLPKFYGLKLNFQFFPQQLLQLAWQSSPTDFLLDFDAAIV